ncbi:carbohydrate ABC transporter permease [Paenibacillus yanchengensis]|uniref:Carbohydrate ABC transporter permease n=1 Tax=Paenibacillus yanchengensis TaxID=2035833 RepID=A0ABW4YII6_9BACL
MSKWRTREDFWVDTINYILLAVVTIMMVYPFYYILIVSFNVGSDTAAGGGMYFYPRQFTLENYVYFLKEPKWVDAFFVSVLRTIIGTIVSVLFTCLVAYGLAQPGLMFRRTYFSIFVVAMYVSGGLIAYYVILRSIGLINKFGVYIIPSMLSLFFLMIAVSFFREIPPELGESARMDGAGELKIFISLILPLSLPLLATMGLFLGSGQWNAWLDSAYFVQSQKLRTLSFRMIEVMNQASFRPSDAATASYSSGTAVTQFSVQVTAMIISIVPMMAVYPFLQKYFVQGMMLGSVKG